MSSRDRTTVDRRVKVATGPGADEVACLEGLEGSIRGQIVPLTTQSTVIGRDPSATISLNDHGVSRRHARIAVHEDGIVNVLDLQSTNGTFVNGAPIDVAVVRVGDRIQIGPEVVVRFAYRRRDEIAAASRPVKGPPPSVLRPRERDVVRWAAEGLTSAEIADKLGISPRTVSTHLRNIYARLEISSRAALARYAAEHGLLE